MLPPNLPCQATSIQSKGGMTGSFRLAARVPSLISGEERILGTYDDAIKASGNSFPEYPLLVSQRDALRMKVAEMERMQRQAAA